MAINVNSNGYTFAFAAFMVVVVAAVLSFIATSLKPMQSENIEKEKNAEYSQFYTNTG